MRFCFYFFAFVGLAGSLAWAEIKTNQAPPSPSQEAILPQQIHAWYGYDKIYQQHYDGKGQVIAFLEFGSIDLKHVQTYFNELGLRQPKIEPIFLHGNSTTPTSVDEKISQSETEIDLEMAGMIAPGAILKPIMGRFPFGAQDFIEAFEKIISDDEIKVVVSTSAVVNCEQELGPEQKKMISTLDTLLEQAVKKGITVFFASGDSGIHGCSNRHVGVQWPNSSPNVVVVGGTDFKFESSSFNVDQEIGWTNSGGGFSEIYLAPSWQSPWLAQWSMSSKIAAKTPFKRGMPDLSSFSADGQAVYTYDSWNKQAGNPVEWWLPNGTSLAAPTLAGFLALVNQARATPLPYLNPIIYGIRPEDRNKYFNDITSGSNGYTAISGWNPVSGLGSPKADQLFEYLRNWAP